MPAQAGVIRLREGGGNPGSGRSPVRLCVPRNGVKEQARRVVRQHGIRARLDAVGDRPVAVGKGGVGRVGREGGRAAKYTPSARRARVMKRFGAKLFILHRYYGRQAISDPSTTHSNSILVTSRTGATQIFSLAKIGRASCR